jgi:hypothetical protein
LTETRVSLDRPFRALALAAMLLLAALLAPLPAAAQSQQTAQLTVRIQELEEQIRLLTGQVEGLQFQLTQMQTLLERMGRTTSSGSSSSRAMRASPLRRRRAIWARRRPTSCRPSRRTPPGCRPGMPSTWARRWRH